jgi:hypothetical protein
MDADTMHEPLFEVWTEDIAAEMEDGEAFHLPSDDDACLDSNHNGGDDNSSDSDNNSNSNFGSKDKTTILIQTPATVMIQMMTLRTMRTIMIQTTVIVVVFLGPIMTSRPLLMIMVIILLVPRCYSTGEVTGTEVCTLSLNSLC